MTIRSYIINFFILSLGTVFSQEQNHTWFFGYNAGINFNTNPPSAISSPLSAIEGCASVSDSSGKILFFTNGITVWDRNHEVMPNGTGLAGGISSTHAALIVPFPNSSSLYYLFTSEDHTTDGGVSYSIVDMTLNGGYGDIAPGTKNQLLVNQTTEQIAAVLHSNKNDIWVITHKLNSNEFFSYLITTSGIMPNPVISAIGSTYPITNSLGQLKPSNNGKKLVGSSAIYNIIDMFDFNPSTGELSNHFNLNNLFTQFPTIYGIEFSPSDSILYLVSSWLENHLFQVNLGNNIVTTLSSSPEGFYGALQQAPDGKIYIAVQGKAYLNAINFPDKPGNSCEYQENAIALLKESTSGLGLPGKVIIPSKIVEKPSLRNDTILCNSKGFLVKPEFPPNCVPISFVWNDGSTESQLSVYESGLYWVEINSTCGIHRDSINIVFITCESLIRYDLEECSSYMSNGSNMDYSEFIPTYPEVLPCAEIIATNLHRINPQENKHSCTPGIDNSIAMCISANTLCSFPANGIGALRTEVVISPEPDSVIWVTGLTFFEKAPFQYNWMDGPSGLNNYPTRYGLIVMKNGSEIFREENVSTTQDWSLQKFNFLLNNDFRVDTATTFTFELVPYCAVGNAGLVSVWDIDKFELFGGCYSDKIGSASLSGEIKTWFGHPISNVEVRLSDDEEFLSYVTQYSDSLGKYFFDDLRTDTPYFVRAYKNDNMLNGVSAIDLVCIQKHLLGKTPFVDLPKFIAADINNSRNISVMDLVELTKLLLGISQSFPRNTSWRFGPLPQELNGDHMEGFRESVRIEFLHRKNEICNFIGIKTGDLNDDVDLYTGPNIIMRK